ncbi:MAG: helix-turn-helix domain-containing protein [Rickettsiales bacterium]|nr:helix-turn-helix domain-containing protein [Rickettsiales bacterium]
MSDELQKIARILSKERKRQKLNKKTIAKELNITIDYINKIESGNLDEHISKILTSRYIKTYCNYLNINPKQYIKNYLHDKDKNNKLSNKHIIYKITKNNIAKLSAIIFFIYIIIVNIYLTQNKNNHNEQKNNKIMILHHN